MKHPDAPENIEEPDAQEPRCHTFLDMAEVIRRTSLSRAGIYRKIDSGEFPQPVKLGGRRVAFVEAEITNWQERLMEARV